MGSFPEGRKLEDERAPEGYVGSIGTWQEATPERVAHVAKMIRRANPEAFDRQGRNGRIWVERATGREYTQVPGAPLASDSLQDLHVEAFVVVDGQFVFLRSRGDDGRRSSVLIGDVEEVAAKPAAAPVASGGPQIL